jgi:hypothetical protein
VRVLVFEKVLDRAPPRFILIVEIHGGLRVQMGGTTRSSQRRGCCHVERFGLISEIVERFLEFHICQSRPKSMEPIGSNEHSERDAARFLWLKTAEIKTKWQQLKAYDTVLEQ